MRFYLLVFFLITTEIFAQDILTCQGKNDKYKFSIRSENHSLDYFQTQDQGSVGSCYANSLSLALYPEINYSPSANYLALINHQENKGRDITTEGGDSCELFNSIGNNFLCSPKDIIEDFDTYSGINVLIKNLGAFYDDYNNNKLNIENSKYKKIIKSIKDLNNQIIDQSKYLCDSIKSFPKEHLDHELLRDSMYSYFNNTVPIEINYFKDNGFSVPQEIEKYFNKDPVFNVYRPNEEYKKRVEKYWNDVSKIFIYNNDPDIIEEKYKDIIVELYEDFGAEPGTATFECFKIYFDNFEANENNDIYLSLLEHEFDIHDEKICINRVYKDYYDNINVYDFINDFIEEENTCQDLGLVSSYLGLFDAIKIFTNRENNLADQMAELEYYLKNESPNLFEFISNHIKLNDCQNQKSLDAKEIIKDLKCKKMDLITEEDKDKSIEEKKASLQTRLNELVFRKLNEKNGRPIIIDVCTGFFDDPNSAINFDTKNCDESRDHGFHSMNVIGQRCINGKVEYQIQNSWGNYCDYLYNEDLEDYLYECDKNEGNFWVSEEILINNIFGISYLE